MSTTFLNEHLLPGKIGQFFVILSFIASIVSAIAFAASTNSKLVEGQQSWRKIGRTSFVIHSLSVFSIFGILFYIIFVNRYL